MENIEIFNPIEYPNWDKLLLTNENCTFFHTSGWANALCETYKYKPLYFTEIENDKLTGLLPVMEVNSFLTGKRGVSLPFTDQCHPIVKNENNFRQIFNKVIQYGKNAGWKTLVIKGAKEYLLGRLSSETYLTHSLDLTHPEHEVFATFRSSTKRNIKKAVKENVQVNFLNSLESVKEFYRLNCLIRKYHSLPPQPFLFFSKLLEHIISEKKGVVILASYFNKVIAGAVYVHSADRAIFKYGASDKTYHQFRPNNLIMWEAIKWYAKNGFKSINFGRTEPAHKGLLQFKRGWGIREETIYYYKYDLTKDAFVKNSSMFKSSNRIFNRLPMPMLKLIGRMLYRHVG